VFAHPVLHARKPGLATLGLRRRAGVGWSARMRGVAATRVRPEAVRTRHRRRRGARFLRDISGGLQYVERVPERRIVCAEPLDEPCMFVRR
jgi:hypothetical protein